MADPAPIVTAVQECGCYRVWLLQGVVLTERGQKEWERKGSEVIEI